MKFTDLFIQRPVLASVISLLIFIAGLRSLGLLEVRQYPETKNTVVTVTTTYSGASSELVKGFVTQPLQQAMAEAQGIDYLLSTSSLGQSTIEAHMELNYDANAAVAEIQAKVASKRNVLPEAAEDPVIDSTTGDTTALMYLAFYSETMSLPQITDYLLRVAQPQLQALPGVSKARLIGNKTFAMRVWLNPKRMAALGVTAQEVAAVLRENNFLAGVGQTKGKYVAINLTATTDVSEPKSFENLVVRQGKNTLVRLRDVTSTDLGAEDYDSATWYQGRPSVFIGIEQAPGANPLSVAERVQDLLPRLRSQMPEGLNVVLPYDASTFIKDSISEVYRTITEAVLIVLLVIYLTLGSMRAALIPAIAVPLSLIGGAFLMLLMGFSLNLLTLLSMVLAIGLVVDDAIIVVENVQRHIEMGKPRFQAAIEGARELGLPILAMTTTLVAVYAPIGFMGGLVGTLFTEFAFSLAGAVLISGIVALTLSPMLSSKVLKAHDNPGRFEQAVERFFGGVAQTYRGMLHSSLDTLLVTLVFGLVVLGSIYFMFTSSQNELAPTEDQGILFFQATAPRTATLDYLEAYSHQIQQIFETIPEYKESFYILGGTDSDTAIGGFKMPPQSQRNRTQMELEPELQSKLQAVSGFQTAVFARPSLPGSGGGLPIQFVITTDADYRTLNDVADQLIDKAMHSGKFIFLRKSISYDKPMITLAVNRDRAGDLGITMNDIGTNLTRMLGGGYVNWFSLEGRSYKVIPQVQRRFRLNAQMLDDYYLQTAAGKLVPLSTVVSFQRSIEPSKRIQFQQLNALTVEGVMAPSIALGDALGYLQNQAESQFPKGFSYDYTGSSRQYAQQGSALIVTFFLSLLVIYLVLAAQFESWRDPAIILVSVPMSIAGAMIFITLGLASVNIYTQVGLITLIGIVSKNGILIVEFANQLQKKEGFSKREAVEEAATIRLRPIIMTTLAMVVAMIPLLTASGPGAVSRFDIGLTVATGLGIGTLFTLFVLPAFYVLFAREHSHDQAPAENANGEHG